MVKRSSETQHCRCSWCEYQRTGLESNAQIKRNKKPWEEEFDSAFDPGCPQTDCGDTPVD